MTLSAGSGSTGLTAEGIRQTVGWFSMGRSWSIGLTLLYPDGILLSVGNEMMEMFF